MPVLAVRTAAGGLHQASSCCELDLSVQGVRFVVQAAVLPSLLDDVDIIIGSDWLGAQRAVIDMGKGECSWSTPSGRQQRLKLERQMEPTPKQLIDGCLAALRTKGPDVSLMSAVQAARAVKRKGTTAYLMVVQPDGTLSEQQPTHPPTVFASCPKSTRGGSVAAVAATQESELTGLLQEFSDVFAPLTGLPPERPDCVDHTIRLVDGAGTPYRPQHRMSPAELAEVKSTIADYLAKGLIEPSSSPYGAPVLFVRKKDGSLRMCMDYRALNKLTVRDRYPLPRIDDLLDCLAGKVVFTSLDLQSGYHQILITPEDRPKTAFTTPLGHFQFKVLCFGLCNAPATFQRAMNHVFAPYIGKFVLVYLDDILVMSNTPEEHIGHLRVVLGLLRQHKYLVKLSKCEFMKSQVKFLGHIVSSEGVQADPAKVEAVANWPVPNSLTQLRSFLGLVNQFRHCVPHLATIAAPLSEMTKKEVAVSYPWHQWGAAALYAFRAVKQALASPPVMALPVAGLPFTITTDASDKGTGAVLQQQGRVIAYDSQKYTDVETRYSVGEKELLSVVKALQKWRCYVEGTEFIVETDHKPNTFVLTQPTLSRRQAKWVQEMDSLYKGMTLVYRKGSDNGVADALSRHPLLDAGGATVAAMTRSHAGAALPAPVPASGPASSLEEGGVSGRGPVQRRRPAKKSKRARQHTQHAEPEPNDGLSDELREKLMAGYEQDADWVNKCDRHGLHQANDLWYTQEDKVAVPADDGAIRAVLYEMHDAPLAGHTGAKRTLQRVKQWFWWPTIKHDVKEYVKQCDKCQRNKPVRQGPSVGLSHQSTPSEPWESVAVDMITKLPESEGYDSILHVVDRFSKMSHLIPCKEAMSAPEFAALFIQHVVKLHGVPADMVSDRGTQWNNQFWQAMAESVGMKMRLTMAWHPRANGLVERTNATVEEALRMYVDREHQDWARWLPMVEFAINSSKNEATGHSPFFINYGRHIPLPSVRVVKLAKKMPGPKKMARQVQQTIEEVRKKLKDLRAQQMSQQEPRKLRVFQPGEQVLLSTKNFTFPDGVKKLHPKYLGPFAVVRMRGDVAVELALPKRWQRRHKVFHVNLVRKYYGSGAYQPPPPCDWDEDGEPLYTVRKLLDRRKIGRRFEYLVRWEGYSSAHDTWEPRKCLIGPGCAEMVAEMDRVKG